MGQVLWKRDPAAWRRIVQAQLKLAPVCVVCGEGDLPEIRLTAHHLSYERERAGYEPVPGEDLVTMHHETCHAYVEWLIETQKLPRGGAHLKAKKLAAQECKRLGIAHIYQWWRKDAGTRKKGVTPPGAPFSRVMRNSARQAKRHKRTFEVQLGPHGTPADKRYRKWKRS